ncbi:MAG: hypothetical protein ACI85F_000200 [Bacteroidia bacterium]
MSSSKKWNQQSNGKHGRSNHSVSIEGVKLIVSRTSLSLSAMKAKELGTQLNVLLRKVKQIPSPKPIIGSPRVQGWLAGVAFALIDGLDEATAQSEKSEFYVTAFDGTSMGQAFGLDMVISGIRIQQAGPTLGYNAIYHEFMEKGKMSFLDGKLNHTILDDLLRI